MIKVLKIFIKATFITEKILNLDICLLKTLNPSFLTIKKVSKINHSR